MNVKIRLIIMNFLEYAVWGAYLTSMGSYLVSVGMSGNIGIFYAVQGIVSLFMPALIGIIADRYIPAQRMLGICHALAAIFMCSAGFYAFSSGTDVQFAPLFALYTMSVAFFMPTISLSNSVAYTVLRQNNYDTVKDFPSIRVFGTIGFICSMLFVDLMGLQHTYGQFFVSGILSVVLALYTQSLPNCPVSKKEGKKQSIVDALGLRAFTLFKEKKMALFFIFSMLLGVSLQITNGFANPFISGFKEIPEYANTFGANHANMLISISQMSETLCILLIPFFLRKFGIKKVMLMAMFAWVLRFAFFGLGDPGSGVWLFVLSMLVYGVAFDFFNVSGSLYVDKETDPSIRSSAQGVFMMMTNGFGATIGTLGAQVVVNRFVYSQTDPLLQVEGWNTSWFVFAGYALVVAILFAIFFKYKYKPEETPQ